MPINDPSVNDPSLSSAASNDEAPEEAATANIAVRRHGRVAELVLNRPHALNAISTALAAELGDKASALASDPGVRALRAWLF